MTSPNNTTLPQGVYTYNSGISATSPFITYYSLRDPTTSDINFPIQKRWVNFTTTPPKEWILESLPGANNITTAQWKLLTGPGSGVLIDFIVPNGSSPVFPDGSGNVTLTSTGGTVVITGSPSTINFDVEGGTMPVQRLETDDGLFETPSGSPGTIIIHGTNGVITSQGTAHQVNVGITGGTYIQTVTGDDTTVVSPDSSGNIDLIGTVVTNATHAKAVFTHSPSAHNESIDVQVAAAIVSTDVTKVGLAAFQSSQFGVDANGFVTLVGGTGFQSVNIQTFISTGTYTPTAGMSYCVVQCIGGGGGGGGAPTCNGSQSAGAGGGGSGENAVGFFSAATIGASQAVTIGAAGTAGAAGTNNGGTGGTTSLGALITAIGGGGGTGSTAQGGPSYNLGGVGGTGGTGGAYRSPGSYGGTAIFIPGQALVYGGWGADGPLGGGGGSISSNAVGSPASGFGSGGGGASVTNSQTQQAGAAGTKGIVIVTEFII